MSAVKTSSVPTSVAVVLLCVHWFVADEASKDKDKEGKRGKEGYACGEKGHLKRDCWSQIDQERTANEVEGTKGGRRRSTRVCVHNCEQTRM